MDLRHVTLLLIAVLAVGCGRVVGGDNGVVVNPCHRRVPCIPNTLVADTQVCTTYWQCLDTGLWVNRTCEDGQFDWQRRICVQEGNATCQEPCKLYCKRPNTCIMGSRLPDPFDCSRFYMCEYGAFPPLWTRFNCAEGTKFDLSVMLCVTDSPTVVCHPPCDLDPCEGLPIPCPMKGYRMAFTNYSAAYYHCAEKDGQWNVKFCGVAMKFDYKTKVCSYTGIPHPGCSPTTTPDYAPTSTTTRLTTVHTYPEVVDHTITVLTEDVLEGGSVNISCRVQLTQAMFGSMFTWYLDDVKVTGGTASRFSICLTQIPYGVMGYLVIDPLAWTDTGSVSCLFTSSGGLGSKNETIFAVLPKPTVHLSNMSATVTKGDQLQVTCTADVIDTGDPDVDKVWIEWFKDEVNLKSGPDEIISGDTPKKSHLTLRNIQSSNTYGCQASNQAGRSPLLECEVTAVEKEAPKCAPERKEDVQWPETATGRNSRKQCPGNATGTATRRCTAVGAGANWEDPNLNNCVDPQFQVVMNQISDLKSGLGTDSPEVVASVADTLAQQTASRNSSTKDPIKPGNLNVSVSAIKDLADLHEIENAAAATDKEVESVVLTASNLLDSDNIQSWMSVLKEDSKRAARIMKSLDKYTGYVANMLQGGSDESGQKDFVAPNVVLTSGTWEDGNLTLPDSNADWVKEETSDFVVITNSTLTEMAEVLQTRRLVVSSTYYRTLESLLPLQMSEDMPSNSTLMSRILSVTVDDLPEGLTFNNSIHMEFGNRENVTTLDSRLCGFWNYTTNGSGHWSTSGCRMVYSDQNITSCQCDHMTNFAILVSRYRPTGAHLNMLSILTTVGLCLSIVCLLTTIIIYAMLWKSIKSDYALMLVNLCGSLAIANLVFLVGIEQTDSRVTCGVIAVVLHYLFLVAFFLMLAESIELLLYIVYVFHIHTDRETALLLAAAWGTPVIIIGICLGATQGVGYGNEEFCWLTIDSGLIWAFLGPIIAIILANIVILAIVLKKIYDSGGLRNESKSGRLRSAMWNMVVLAPLLGVSWTFGLFSFNESTIAFQYIFTALNAFQGLFIFIFHCLFNKRLRDAFIEKFAVEGSSTLSSTAGSKGQAVQSRSRSCSITTGKVNTVEVQMSATPGVFKTTRFNTASTTASSYDNPGLSVSSDVTSGGESPDVSYNRRGRTLSANKPDIVQTLPDELSFGQVSISEPYDSQNLTRENIDYEAASGNAPTVRNIEESCSSDVDLREHSGIRLRHEYVSYRI